MKNWKIALLFLVAFAVVGLADSPEYYDFRSADPIIYKHETDVIKERVYLVEKHVENLAESVYSPSPIFWR